MTGRLMRYTAIIPLLAAITITGCKGVSGMKNGPYGRSGEEKSGAFFQNGLQKWGLRNFSRCAACHENRSLIHGYFRGWDRYGFTDDHTALPPFGYMDPWGLDVPVNPYREYYFTGWWKSPWPEEKIDLRPDMHLDGYGPVNEGRSKPGDFKGPVVVVDQNGGGDARTIGEGVKRASRGTLIFVRAGTYHERVRLKEGIRIWGENPETTIIDCGSRQSCIVAANGCDISGFTFTGTGKYYGTPVFSVGVHVPGCDSTLVIRGNIFSGYAVSGIFVESPHTEAATKHADYRTMKFRGWPNPRIIGNTFHAIGERAVYCVHSSPEIANNIFAGNFKTVGMIMQSRPFIHHNIFYRNTMPITINRSMPVVAYNILLCNCWGQHVIEGSFPVIHDNVVWESPWFREFGEDGRPIPYTPFPGTGNREVNPELVNPAGGDFRISLKSPVKRLSNTKNGFGLIKGYGIQYPPIIHFEKNPYDEFVCRNDTILMIVTELDRLNESIETLDLSYSVEYRNFLEVKYHRSGGQSSAKVMKNPVSGFDYHARWFYSMGRRHKTYRMTLFDGRKTRADSGRVYFDGERVRVSSGRFKTDSRLIGDPRRGGTCPGRENPGGLPLDYDQYLNGAIGPLGTFYYGFLRIFGGNQPREKAVVDGHECLVIGYPGFDAEQTHRFYLDPAIGYRPRKLEQYSRGRLRRSVDSYTYENIGGMFLPVRVTVTDFAVKEPYIGKIAGVCVMRVDPGSIRLNGNSPVCSLLFPSEKK